MEFISSLVVFAATYDCGTYGAGSYNEGSCNVADSGGSGIQNLFSGLLPATGGSLLVTALSLVALAAAAFMVYRAVKNRRRRRAAKQPSSQSHD